MPRRLTRLVASALVASSLVLAWFGCGDSTTEPVAPLTIPEGCNPIGAPNDCLLPYPSDFFLKDGKVTIPESAEITAGGKPVDMLALHRPDGFSVGSPILVLFPEGVDDSNLVFWKKDTKDSLGDDSPTVIIDGETGERVLHFAELDPRAMTDDRRALILRPLVRLESGHRYVVALRNLKNPAGKLVASPAGFASLRDDQGSRNSALAALSPHYEKDIFPLLEKNKVERSSVQLAWDFTTSTERNATQDMLDIRTDVLARLAKAPPEITVTKVDKDTSDDTAVRIQATVKVPLYVDSAKPGAAITYDASGKPTAKTTADVPFTVWIPKSVASAPFGSTQARLVQYGHGFFADQSEANDIPAAIANEKGFVFVAADWWGLSKADESFIANQVATDITKLPVFTDRIQQAMVNFTYVGAAAQGPVAALSDAQVNGQPAYDPSVLYYYGISMGGILGSTYLALNPNVDRAGLSVCGSNISLILFRSEPFLPFLALINIAVPDPLDEQKLVAFLQSTVDRIDPLTYAPHLLDDRLPGGSKDFQIAMQIGLGDPSVPNIASYFEARTLGIPTLQPSPVNPDGLDTATSPHPGSAMTLFDFGVAENDIAEAGAVSNDVHTGVRKSQGSKDQIDLFFHPGAPVTQPCKGPCKGM